MWWEVGRRARVREEGESDIIVQRKRPPHFSGPPGLHRPMAEGCDRLRTGERAWRCALAIQCAVGMH